MAEILAQEEIDTLLSAYSSGGVKTGERSSVYEVSLYDFAHPEQFSKEELRQIEIVQKTFANRLANHFSAVMRNSIEVSYTSLDQATYEEYLRSIPSPSLISTFRAEPFGTRCVIEINPNIVFALVDMMTGGNGDAYLESRDMTEIELHLMEPMIRAALSHYNSSWEHFSKIDCQLERVGGNQMVSPITGNQDRVLSTYYEIKVGSQVGLISICMPIHTAEAILDDFSKNSGSGNGVSNAHARALIAENLSTSMISACAVLGKSLITIDEIISLEKGDCIRLEQPALAEITIEIEGVEKFRGVPGLVGRRLGIHITQDIESVSNFDKEPDPKTR